MSKLRTIIVAVAVTALGTLGAAGASAGGAPDGESSAVALGVAPLTTGAGGTDTNAGSDGAHASASPLTVLGDDFGATSASDGSAQQAKIASVGDNVVVGSSSSTTENSENGNEAEAESGLVEASIPGLARLTVLASHSQSAWTPNQSTASSRSDGAALELGDGDLVVVLLHAEGSSDGTGRLYVLRLQDETYIDSDRRDPVTIDVPGVLTVELLNVDASGGRFSGEVVQTAWLDDADLSQVASAVRAQGGAFPVIDPGDPDIDISTRVKPFVDQPVSLPRTGADLATLWVLAAGLILGGASMCTLRRAVVA